MESDRLPESTQLVMPRDYLIELRIFRALLEGPKTRIQIANEVGMRLQDIRAVVSQLKEASWISNERHARPSEQKLGLSEGGECRASVLKDVPATSLHETKAEDRKDFLAVLYTEGLVKALGKGWVRAAYALGETRDVRAAGQLIEALRSNLWEMRAAAAFALGEIRDALAVEPLISLLNDYHKPVRDQASYALGKIGDPRAVRPLIQEAKGDYKMSSSAWGALSKIGAPVIEPLLRTYEEVAAESRDAYWHFFQGVAKVIEHISDPKAVDKLIGVLEGRFPRLRARAAFALGEVGDAKASEALIRALKSKDGELRLWAAWALGNIGDASAIEALSELLDDENEEVAKYAEEALKKIRGEKNP